MSIFVNHLPNHFKNMAPLLLLVLILAQTVAGQSPFGTISGRVVDLESGQPLSGANIVVRGTFRGTATDEEGGFKIANLPPGVYSVVVSMIGYEKATISGIRVDAAAEVQLDIKLKPTIIATEQIVITASRREQSLREVPVSVSTVTAQQLAERITITVDDALRYVPGVNLLQDQVNIRGSTGYSRGVGSRVLLLLDGIPYLTGDTGEISWETIPVHQIDRIEVVKGAGSALYGSSALGGVINIITKEAPEGKEIRFRLFSGLYDQPQFPEWRWSSKSRFNSGVIGMLGGKSGPLSYVTSVYRGVDESYRENDAYHRWGFYSKLKYDLSPTQSGGISVNYLDRTHGNFFWWKSLREATRPDDEQRNGNVTSRRGNLSLFYKEFVSDKFFYTIRGQYFGNFWRDDSAGRVNNVSTSHLFHAEVQATYEISPANILTLGASTNYDLVNSNLFELAGQRGGSPEGVGGAFYLQDEVSILNDLKVTAGVRLDLHKVSMLESATEATPRFGFTYDVSESATLRGSIGAGFRYPSIAEIFTETATSVAAVRPNLQLRAERSLSYELGGSQRLGEMHFDLSFFQTELKDLIEAGISQDSTGFFVQFDNVVRARIQGAEVGIGANWFDRLLSTDVGYTYIWARDLQKEAPLKFRPRHMFYASASVQWEAFRSSCDYRFISRIETIDENLSAFVTHADARVPIHVTDLRFSYLLAGFGLPLQLGMNVKNLFNYHYVELVGNLAPVRTFFVSLDGSL